MNSSALKMFLDRKVNEFNRPAFIVNDPISVPHLFTKKQDIEIAGFFAAILAWGNRTSIIRKSKDILQRMDFAPYEFVKNAREKDLMNLQDFKHRTFNATDLLYFIAFLQFHYKNQPDPVIEPSLQTAFTRFMKPGDSTVERALNGFYHYFFSLEDVPARTKKHIAAPEKKSTCKRLNMFLRWMVRKDERKVDFGIWNQISSAQLVCPVDLHVARVARGFGLISRKQADWRAALELTDNLKKFDAEDPVKYDFALFGLGAMEKF